MPTAETNDIFAGNRALGRVRIEVESKDGVTRRRRVHESGSLRARFPNGSSEGLDAVLVNTAGGMAAGDAFVVEIVVGETARLAVTTAAAEKIYRSLGPATSVDVKIDVAAGGKLAWMPQETILFDSARLTRSIEVDLAEDSSVLLAEPLVFGRTGMGETVTNGALLERWRVRRQGRLVYADGITLDGAIADALANPAATKGGRAVATVLMTPADDTSLSVVHTLNGRLRGEVGASSWNGLLMARLCAVDGSTLRDDMIDLLGALRGAPLPRLWLN